MPNPYADLPESAFWKTAVASCTQSPVPAAAARRPRLTASSRVATAGSCFAQNLAKHLRQSRVVQFVETEPLGAEDPVFSGRYGNIYTARQLVQLFDEWRAGAADPACAVPRRDGRWVDIHRPLIAAGGFDSAAAVLAARQAHITAIGPAFTDCDLFVFTLGLTEGWQRTDGRALPVCPGVYSDATNDYRFHNYGFAEVLADTLAFIDRLRGVNPKVKVLLTVSPVPLTATMTGEHVMVATGYSKAVLRAVCGEILTSRPGQDIFYFPAFEIVANPYTDGSTYEANRRTVRADAVAAVMALFEAQYLDAPAAAVPPAVPPKQTEPAIADEPFCDEVAIEKSLGF